MILIAAAGMAAAVQAQEPVHIRLWDNSTAPTSNGLSGEEKVSKGGAVSNTTTAEMWVYKAGENATGQGIVFFPGSDKLHAVALADDPILYFEISDDSPEGVEHRVEDKALERRLRVARRRRHLFDNGVQDVINPFARLPARPEDVLAVAAQ